MPRTRTPHVASDGVSRLLGGTTSSSSARRSLRVRTTFVGQVVGWMMEVVRPLGLDLVRMHHEFFDGEKAR